MASSSSSSSSLIPLQSKNYDVFISFRGDDVRLGFLSHLREAFIQNEVNAFVDEKLDRGEEISSSLLEIIEQSRLSVVIFSENYAYSPWCMDELMKILECKKDMRQLVLPVFYCVDPTHVQELTGNFGAALAKHREDFKNSLDKVESWCQALREIAGMAGLVSHNIKPDSELIKEIVKHISEKLNDGVPSDSYDKGLVGIDSRVKDAESLLCPSPCAMLCKCREKFEKCGRMSDLKEILFQVLGRETCNLGLSTRRRLSREKVLFALDDVSDSDQIERSMGNPAMYGPGSKFIITSRDKQLLRNMEAQIYEVEKLNDCEASWLFGFHAFKQDNVGKEYMVFSKKAVKYAQGNPLAIKVLGSNLYSRSVKEWADELEKLEGTSDEKVQRILRLSYDALSAHDKEIFLDIVCFFEGKDKVRVENILGTPGSIIGISRLADMSLISIANNKLHIHDLLQQMGKDITCEEKQIGQRSRLWHPKDIYYLLTRAEGTGANKGISLDMSNIREVELSPTVFERTYNLKFLKFSLLKTTKQSYRDRYQCPLKYVPLSSCAENLVDLCLTNSKIRELWNGVQHLGNLKYVNLSFSKDLIRIPDLSGCPNIEVLDLYTCTSLVEIPPSIKCLSKLTSLCLTSCASLCDLPSLLHLKSLEVLFVQDCPKIIEFPVVPCDIRGLNMGRNAIEQVPSSIGGLSHLYLLDLGWSTGLESLPDSICNLKSLREFRIGRCGNLKELPENLGNLESLERLLADGSAIKELPDSICNLKKLATLSVERCVNLLGPQRNWEFKVSRESLCHWYRISKGAWAYGNRIKELPDSFGNLKQLTWLTFRSRSSACTARELWEFRIFGAYTASARIKRLPSLTGFPLLGVANLDFCGLLEFPSTLCHIVSLKELYIGGNNFETIPDTIKKLSRLVQLELSDCMRLKYLPELPSLSILSANNCTCLESASCLFQLQSIKALQFGNCINLDGDECSKIVDHLLATPWQREVALCFPGSEVPQWIKYQNDSGSSFFLSFRQLEQGKSTCFTFCAVFDPKVCHPYHFQRIGCTVHFINESGHSQYQFDHYWDEKNFLVGYDRTDRMVVHSEHIFFWRSSLNFIQNSMVFQFFVEDIKKRRSYNGIVKCCIHLEEEEEPPLKRLKHGDEQPPQVTFKALGGGYDFSLDINTLTR
ncbi:disease resistance protein RPV1-like [Hevea brasiliensis]|uniref:disease resistance protein RPV1-like n=1 Tax=Hevea brasiliensis TaxID=3981 RepID=UPI0025F4350E|nr:disease resistance protein RPV1-like [Hevea brasiliensis]